MGGLVCTCVCVCVCVCGRMHISEHIRIISIFNTSKYRISQTDPVKRSSDSVAIRPTCRGASRVFSGAEEVRILEGPFSLH